MSTWDEAASADEPSHNWRIMSSVAVKRPLHENPQYYQHDDCFPFYTDGIPGVIFDVKMCPFCGTKKFEKPGST